MAWNNWLVLRSGERWWLCVTSCRFSHADLDHEQWFAFTDKPDGELHGEYALSLYSPHTQSDTDDTNSIAQAGPSSLMNDSSFSIHGSSRPSSKRSKNKQKTDRVNTTLFQVLESRWSRRGALPKSVPKEDLTRKQGWVCGWLCVPWSMAEPAVVIAGGLSRGAGGG